MGPTKAVYAWAFPSSHLDADGKPITVYETLLHVDGTLSCGCQGWIIKRAGKERSCKHTKLVAAQASAIYAKWKAGDFVALPTAEDYPQPPAPKKAAGVAKAAKPQKAVKAAPKTKSKPVPHQAFHRCVDIDED